MPDARIFQEEDRFPQLITGWETRSFGHLFCNPDNPASYDANHALLLRERTHDPARAVAEIVSYYQTRGQQPILYQSASEEGYFREISDVLAAHGLHWWQEEQRYMLLQDPCAVQPSPGTTTAVVEYWDASYAPAIFDKAGEPWETDVARRMIANGGVVYVARKSGYPIGIIYGHVHQGVARVDYMLVPQAHRRQGAGHALIRAFVLDPRIQAADVCYLWTDNPAAERIYAAAGFRYAFTATAARAAQHAPSFP